MIVVIDFLAIAILENAFSVLLIGEVWLLSMKIAAEIITQDTFQHLNTIVAKNRDKLIVRFAYSNSNFNDGMSRCRFFKDLPCQGFFFAPITTI